MNKPAPKEPSMDEILSSIRQIIADDDAAPAPRRAPAASSVPARMPQSFGEADLEVEPLALSAEQILREAAEHDAATPQGGFGAVDRVGLRATEPLQLVDPEDIAFDVDDEPEPEPVAPRFAPPRPTAPVSRAAPLPDPRLSAELAEELLEPATQSAVKSTFARLNGATAMGSGMTLEQLTRDMLRPMLKDWLDENLPTMVERMVEREIARISRGGR